MPIPRLICLLLAVLLSRASAEIIPSAERWINRLNATSVNTIDEQVLSQRFDQWFAGLNQVGEPVYLVMNCEDFGITVPPQKKEMQKEETKTALQEIPVCISVEAGAGPQ